VNDAQARTTLAMLLPILSKWLREEAFNVAASILSAGLSIIDGHERDVFEKAILAGGITLNWRHITTYKGVHLEVRTRVSMFRPAHLEIQARQSQRSLRARPLTLRHLRTL
jgi:hypothetical protein